MDNQPPSGEHKVLRPDHEPFNLGDALCSICDQVRMVLGWRIATLLLNDETTGLCCLIAASGIEAEVRSILVGAAISATDDLVEWLESKPQTGDVYVLERFAAGSPLGIETLIGHTDDANGFTAVVPVYVRGRTVGFVAAYGGRDEAIPDEPRLGPLILVAASVAALIDQSTSAERATRRLQNGQVMARLSNRILHHGDIDQILDVTVGDLFSHLEADICAEFRVRGGRLALAHEMAKPSVTRTAAELPLSAALQSARAPGVTVFDERDASGELKSSMLIAPVFVRSELFSAIVCATFGEARQWQPYEIELMAGMADQLGIAVSEATLRSEEEVSRRDLESLLDASRSLAQANDLDGALTELLKLAESIVSSDASAVLLAGEPPATLRVLAHRGCGPEVEELKLALDDRGPAAASYRTSDVVTVDGVDGAPCVLDAHGRSALAVPLRLSDATIGVLLFESRRERAFGDREIKLCGALAHEAVVAIHRTQLFDRVALGKREWETTFDAMADGVFLLDRDGRVVRVNKAAGRLFGFEPKDLRGATCCSLVCDRTASRECVTRGFNEDRDTASFDATIGDEVYDVTLDAIRNRLGSRTGTVLVLRRRNRAQHVDDIDAEVARAIAASTSIVLLLDGDGAVRWANAAAEHQFGGVLVPLVHVAALFEPSQTASVREALAAARSGAPRAGRFRCASSGDEVQVSFNASPHGEGDAVVVVLGAAVASEQ